jgi:serine protease AprX
MIINEKPSFSSAPKVYTERYIVKIESPETKNELISKGCKVDYELEEKLIATCPKNIGQSLKNAKRERLLSPMLVNFSSEYVNPNDLQDANDVGASEVWFMGITGKNRTVAILDTGIDYNHTELSSSYIGGYDFINNKPDPIYDSDCDICGHGTLVAGIITSDGKRSASKGIAPDAKIIVGKVCGVVVIDGDKYFGCPEGAILAGFEWAVKGLDGKKNSGDEPDVISTSLGTTETWVGRNCDEDSLASEVNKIARTVPVVVAAGNYPFGVSSPACARNAIAVGALDVISSSYVKDYLVADFSGRGMPMKHHGVLAPGVFVYTTYPKDSYANATGTSLSAPYVSGMIALMKQKDPSLTPSRISSIIFASSKHLQPYAFISEVSSYEEGHGRIDVLAAIKMIH